MSFVQEHVKSIESQLDQLLLTSLNAERGIQVETLDGSDDTVSTGDTRRYHLEALTKAISTISTSPLKRSHIRTTIQAFDRLVKEETSPSNSSDLDLEWFLLAKITNRVYGHVLQALIDQTLLLNDDLWYYLDILSSASYTALYSLQTSPLRFWGWSQDVYVEVQTRGISLSDGWQQFYGHVRSIIRQRSLADVQRRAAAPLALIQGEVRRKITALERAKRVNASAVGYLLSNGFNDEGLRSENLLQSKSSPVSQSNNTWKTTIMRSVSSMDAVFNTLCDGNLDKDEFEAAVNTVTRGDSLDELSRQPTDDIQASSLVEVLDRLSWVLSDRLPTFDAASRDMLQRNSKPSRWIRYWLPATALLISSSTILRIVANRKAEIVDWIRELGSTVIDFWRNWVIEPTRKIIGTIRHDESSEVSIMSKRSLQGDQESLQRMVVDFAVDNPEGRALNETQIAEIRSKVQEGDLTPVLMAYERELKSPLYGSVRGNLIRTLLIQIQKTKVDVEVAMGGIDNLLKSQELVFGFVGLTPGILVCLGLFRWLGKVSSTRQHAEKGQKQSHSLQVLRNIDRILTASPQSDAGMLSFEEYGLLVCEAVVLRDIAVNTFSRQALRNFILDFNDLIDNSSGVGRQIRVTDRIRWAYSKWL